ALAQQRAVADVTTPGLPGEGDVGFSRERAIEAVLQRGPSAVEGVRDPGLVVAHALGTDRLDEREVLVHAVDLVGGTALEEIVLRLAHDEHGLVHAFGEGFAGRAAAVEAAVVAREE